MSIDDSQFSFVLGRGTTDTIFVVRQLQEKYLAANKRLYMAFVDLEKAFDRVPRKVIWWALRKLCVDEWIVRLVQGMYSNARSRVHIGEEYSARIEKSLVLPVLDRFLSLKTDFVLNRKQNKRAMTALSRSPEYHWNQIIPKSVHRFSRRSRLKLYLFIALGAILFNRAERFEQFL